MAPLHTVVHTHDRCQVTQYPWQVLPSPPLNISGRVNETAALPICLPQMRAVLNSNNLTVNNVGAKPMLSQSNGLVGFQVRHLLSTKAFTCVVPFGCRRRLPLYKTCVQAE